MKNPALLEEMKTYKGRDEVPADFDTFWDKALANLTELPEYKLKEQDFSIPNVACYELSFKGTRDGLVYARVVFPKSDQKVPVIFHFHGYMGRCWDWTDMLAYTVAGYGLWCGLYGRKRSIRLFNRRRSITTWKHCKRTDYTRSCGRSA